MYAGRIVAVGRTPEGANAALYRVSSRSFPNRQAVDLGGKLAIVPREGHEGDVQKNQIGSLVTSKLPGMIAIT